MAYGVAPQVLLTCVYIDHFILLTLPYDLTANIEWDMAIDLKGFARQHASSAKNIKARLLQATMLSSYQAHQHAQLKMECSTMSLQETLLGTCLHPFTRLFSWNIDLSAAPPSIVAQLAGHCSCMCVSSTTSFLQLQITM